MHKRVNIQIIKDKEITEIPDDNDVYLKYYSGKGFHVNYSCLNFLRKTHKLVQ
jgi:hypothetical protein